MDKWKILRNNIELKCRSIFTNNDKLESEATYRHGIYFAYQQIYNTILQLELEELKNGKNQEND